MKFGYREICLEHDTGSRHPESPDRLRAIKRTLADSDNVEYVPATDIPRDAVWAVHDHEYLENVRQFCANGGGNWDADTVAVEATWDAAVASATLAAWAADEAVDGADGAQTPFSLGRPPGHHAVEDDAMGFCFLNNAAVAAEHALNREDVDRVAILDWDVHHGNGTQDIFYDRSDVYYASFHEEGLYPGTGDVGETGADAGRGRTLNVPFPSGCGDADYLAVHDEVVAPEFEGFDPDLLIASAGFDAHENDPISRMLVSTVGFGALAGRLRDLTDRIGAGLAFVLEGGYGLETLSAGVREIHEVLNGAEAESIEAVPTDGGQNVLDSLVYQGFGSR
ncbi:Histone deacetylase [Halorhabdus sp. SVX81]|uniref:histone deacetylase family protein n=1 Tax=Halorhabdus sp. SVX81 TaxID=2978283 RepID=UPI0023DA7DEE|nr:histone deacetylase [Halorhabdus sp. SVX81]WEL18479.1 Histone deacetylase [Halorhabdus sp. SVX81]